MKGRKPKPTTLKILQGNPGRRPLNKQEPKPKGGVRCSAWLHEYGKREWRRLAPELLRLGLLTKADQTTFACYCQAVAEVQLALECINEMGRTYKAGEREKANPAVSHLKSFLQEARAFGALFGLSPSDRSRLDVRTPDDEDLDELLFGPFRKDGA